MPSVNAMVAALGGMVLERLPDERFAVRGTLPSWSTDLPRTRALAASPFVAEDAFPFLSVFMPEAEEAWRAHTRADSDFWTEVDAHGNEVHLEASAVDVEGACVLVIMRNERLFSERQRLLQRARELRMTHASLMKEIEQKDVLIHTIVHDLAAPLHSIIGVLSLLAEQPLENPAAQWIQLAMQAATRQRGLIVEILDVFAAEGAALASRTAHTVDLAATLNAAIAEREPVARQRDVRIERVEVGESPCPVLAEETRLVRVLTNLLDNAFRHSPPGSVVRVVTRAERDAMAVIVEDEGPGVPADVLPRLFERFGRSMSGGAGLGLFFCRIAVESWKGAIGYERAESGGARFWIRLRLAARCDEDDERERRTSHGEPSLDRR